jgi:AraC-like DNA-binding protein
MIRHVLGRNWRPAEVHFEHMGHDDDRALSRIFNAPVSFGHSTNRLIIHTDDLKRTNTHYNASMVPFVQRYLFDLLEAENVTKTCTELVQLAVAKRMGERAVDVRAVAGDLGMSSRALQRHLADEGTTFRAIVAAYRRDVASRLLGKGGLPITAVAHNLGYADGAVLARSFKAWTGSTPRQFARQKAR